MRILAIETASEACSIALFDNEALIAHDHQVLGRGHAEALVPMIAALPNKGRADRILASLGPGSFTGVRIGIATARALGFAWGAEVLGYSTLGIVAAPIIQTVNKQEMHAVTVCMNGGHGEWFVQNFAASGEPETNAQSLKPEQISLAGIHRVIVGNRANECAALFDGHMQALDALPDARNAFNLPASQLIADLTPLYGRAPDATPQKEAMAQ